MKKHILSILLCFVCFLATAQTFVYNRNSNFTNDIICTVEDGKVYNGNSNFRLDIIANVKDSKIYKGNFTFIKDIIANVRDGKVYRGNSFFQGDILFNIRDGVIYNGNSISSLILSQPLKMAKYTKGDSILEEISYSILMENFA